MISQEAFVAAARNGHVETVEKYLSQSGADIECRGYLNMTALLHSSRNGHLEIVNVLLKNGADIHNAWYPETKSGTALEMAAENGHAGIVDILLEAGSSVNNPATGQSPALVAAAMAGRLEIVSRLVDAGANTKSTTGDRTTVLILISGFGPDHAKNPDPGILMECMQKMLDRGEDINASDNLRQYALSRAINANSEVIVKFLLDAGADPDLAAAALPVSQLTRYTKCLKLLIDAGMNQRFLVKAICPALLNGQPDSALALADALPENLKDLHTRGIRFVEGCRTDDIQTFSDHIKTSANPQIMSLYGGVAMSVAMNRHRNQLERIRILLNAGADAGPDMGYTSPIIKAAKAGDFELLKLFIDHGVDPDAGSQDFGTPLMFVLGLEYLYDDRTGPARSFDESVDRLAKLLINAGANVNARGFENRTPLMIAIERFPHNIEPLLQAGADVNAMSKYGWTPLMQADPKMTRRLIEAGADVHLQNKDGRTALFLSAMPAKAAALRKAGADPAQKDRLGMTPLMYQASRGNMKMVRWFAKYKKNINAVDNNGNNAIMHAYGQNALEVITFLKDCGEDVNRINHQGDTLLIRACRAFNPDIIRLALASDIDINAVNAKGETALMIACHSHDDGAVAQLLIKAGADPLIKNPAGKTALDIARTHKPADAIPGLERLIQKTSGKL